jgi:Cu2+-exporting ATPase
MSRTGSAAAPPAVPGPSSVVLLCFHCELPVPEGGRWRSRVLGEVRDFCCAGCQAVAEAISEDGLERYYRLRTASAPPPPAGDGTGPAGDRFLEIAEREPFVRDAGGLREGTLLLEGIRCPACLWLNEERLRALPGVAEASVHYASHSVRVRWDPARVGLPGILAAVRRIGYRARPIDPRHRTGLDEQTRRRDASRLVFAGALGMMVMNLAIASYLAGGPDSAGRLQLWEVFGRWGSLVLTAVLLAYPGQDFFAGAWRDLRLRRAGMDVPVVLGLAAAWVASARATVLGRGPVYYDAIGMLVFFVLLARAFETRARLSAAAALDRFAVLQPATARRVELGGGEIEVSAAELSAGDIVRVLPGEVVPADGILLEGGPGFDESVLTGEPWPRNREPGEPVVAGSSVLGRPAILRIARSEEDSTPGEIRRLLERGLASRPAFVDLADRLAGKLVLLVLLLSAGTAAWWLVRSPSSALPATVAVLIVTCPCALALATPVALAITAGRFAKIGVLPARLSGIERLATADTAVFDKTGTLTLATPRLERVHTAAAGSLDRAEAISIAAALEAGSTHPIARALAAEAGVHLPPPADASADQAGRGIAGTVRGDRWWMGSPDFAVDGAALPTELAGPLAEARSRGRLAAVLSDRKGRTALFTFAEELRPGAGEIVAALTSSGVRRAAVLSGDSPAPVERLARSLGFPEARGGMTVEDKLDWIRSSERSGAGILYVGDGWNDAPTLAAAGASVSFAEAPQLSRLASDFVILGSDLGALAAARRIARRSRRVLVQNLAWALAYNLLAVPLAICGFVPPWAAALGMSASSIFVVGNAARLARPAADERLVETAG